MGAIGPEIQVPNWTGPRRVISHPAKSRPESRDRKLKGYARNNPRRLLITIHVYEGKLKDIRSLFQDELSKSLGRIFSRGLSCRHTQVLFMPRKPSITSEQQLLQFLRLRGVRQMLNIATDTACLSDYRASKNHRYSRFSKLHCSSCAVVYLYSLNSSGKSGN